MSGGHVKLGIFVIVAVMLLVTMLLLLGALQSLKPTVTIETYFAEDIQGLRPGAAVRYRGVDVGTVGRVAFAVAEYPEAGDRANKRLRVDATQVGAKVIREGTNLAMTQKSRIEFELSGGRCGR